MLDVAFLVGQGKNKVKLYGVRALLGVRSRYCFVLEVLIVLVLVQMYSLL
jgi:hypothetical protein